MKTRGGWCIGWRAKAATDSVLSLTKRRVEWLLQGNLWKYQIGFDKRVIFFGVR